MSQTSSKSMHIPSIMAKLAHLRSYITINFAHQLFSPFCAGRHRTCIVTSSSSPR